MTINTSLCPEKDLALACGVGVGRWQLWAMVKWRKQGPEMGQEVVAPADGWLRTHAVSGGGCWVTVCSCAFCEYAARPAEDSAEVAECFLQ